ncbi:MAG TPA: bifunctional glutamate N-acetyltransferase/amino-acid acetyltransferase ArgJ [Bacillota bacterium]|nr:bifunctional glutamate N-acetyltransferase/amino-acid acetyltransferase ArgJ [Peptococcaceae bacterium MAG4]HPU35254.1 bifunctional glutamate N-acetyltransferase/amino-acid acetyltransferase ArgJ [Bacillota bacterium]HPZ43962.1 bifunctional glutamate N-acetyltransferase/amino-acid acetyltransferase ArgJ [Bacillota bacterium]HUM59152.1 bifunctional glutamate N-acetyltransferase/amino-acid acetyltransferase ArgJ [Bacillota bacterium]
MDKEMKIKKENEMNTKLEYVDGGVTAAAGFLAGTAMASIKKPGRRDIAVLYSTVPAMAAGVFTTNRVKAAPVLLSMERLAKGTARAIVINSGNANACNGPQGFQDALAMARAAAEYLCIPEQEVLVASTGVIGQKMPMAKVLPGIQAACAELSPTGGDLAARAIMTTDTFPKEAAVQLQLGGKTVTIGGMAKGSGMIHPNLATMLCFLTTDAVITAGALKLALQYAVEGSFNMVTVDGDTSTNDMVSIMASGLAQNTRIEESGPDYELFREALREICVKLARDIARDGEGATKLLEVVVLNAPSERDARLAARTVAGSSLVKAAVFGCDANWGRIICAAGYSGAEFDPERVDIFLGDEKMAENGCSLDFNEERALEILKRDRVVITLDFKAGPYKATSWGCDLSYDYVKINADYRT